MRNQKSRNRSNKNRNNNRSMGNVMNRVFDSSGPEGKVRGTPQQIIEKYTQLARDAQLSGDRVAFENFQQHSEHYSRLLAAAQKEQEARREQQERENAEKQAQRDAERAERDRERAERAAAAEAAGDNAPQPDVPDAAPQQDDPMAVIDGDAPTANEDEAPKPKQPRRRRAPKPKADTSEDGASDTPPASDPAPQDAAE